jgi:hypothetical protein
MTPRRSWGRAAPLLAAALAGCGSLAPHELPPAAHPAASPPLTTPPAGRVVALGHRLSADAPSARAGERTFVVDRRGNALDVLEGGDRIARVTTALEPTAVTTLDGGRKVAVLAARARVVELFDADSLRPLGRVPAGTGPSDVISDGERRVYVVDAVAGALLVYLLDGGLRPTRRYPLAGSPYAAAFDRSRRRIWVGLTATNRLAELAAGARPHLLRSLPAVRGPRRVVLEPGTGRVVVTGRRAAQVLDLPRTR